MLTPFFLLPHQWAAINNQYAMCKFLLDHGAPINAVGGTSRATPLQWAAQRCHFYTVNLLLQRGADPLITDSQGYNTLHISTFNGNDPSTLIAIGTLNAFSAGILLWVGVAEMWFVEWFHGPLAHAGPLKVAICFFSLVAGLVLMSFLGKWA